MHPSPDTLMDHSNAAPNRSSSLTALHHAAVACAAACLECATGCAGEKTASSLALCISLDKDCAAVCRALADVLSRSDTPTPTQKALIEAVRQASAACATECEKHAAHMAHCKTCAELCRATERACASLT